LGTESLRTYNKIEPSSFTTKDRIIQIIVLPALLLWLTVYAIQTININEYEDDLIKLILYLAAFSFMVSILLGIQAYYKIKGSYSNDQSKWITSAVKWIALGLFLLMTSIPLHLFPESNQFFSIYLIALTYTGKYVIRKIFKNPE
jgi:hypothetical protein